MVRLERAARPDGLITYLVRNPFFKLAPCRLEGIAHRYVQVFVVLMVDNDLAAGRVEDQTDDELFAGDVSRRFHGHTAGRKMRMEMPEPLSAAADQLVQARRALHVAERDL